jgi:hypothetical protein
LIHNPRLIQQSLVLFEVKGYSNNTIPGTGKWWFQGAKSSDIQSGSILSLPTIKNIDLSQRNRFQLIKALKALNDFDKTYIIFKIALVKNVKTVC